MKVGKLQPIPTDEIESRLTTKTRGATVAYKYEYLPSSNTSPRSNFDDYSGAVDTVMIHHWGIDGQRHDNVVAWLRGAKGGQNNTGSSAHYVTSANRVSCLVPESRAAWHCVGRNGSTIGVECRPEMSAGDWRTLVELCADIEERRGSMKYDYHGNNAATECPGRYRKQMGKLVKDINKEHKRRGNDPKDPRRKSGATGSSTAGKQTSSKPKTLRATSSRSSGYTGPSIVEYLKSIGQPSSYSHRAKLARQHGISGYRGTAAQNTALLNKLRGGSSSRAKSGYTGPSIVEYLKSIGQDSSYSARARLARQHGISGYRGTAAQNTRLLKKLRG